MHDCDTLRLTQYLVTAANQDSKKSDHNGYSNDRTIDAELPWACPFKIWEKNESFPPLADALEITYDDCVGRHVKATRDIHGG